MTLYENKVTLRGFAGKNAESFATRQQKTFVILSLATKSGYKDKQTREWINRTEWHHIVAFGTPADYAKDLKKGDYVEIEGELRSSEFDSEVANGKKKITVKCRAWEIHASAVRKLEAPKAQESKNSEPIPKENAA